MRIKFIRFNRMFEDKVEKIHRKSKKKAKV